MLFSYSQQLLCSQGWPYANAFCQTAQVIFLSLLLSLYFPRWLFFPPLLVLSALLLLSSPSLSNRNENTARTMVKAALAASASCVSTKRPCPPLLVCNLDCSEARGNKQRLHCGDRGLTCSLWCRRSRFSWRLCAAVVILDVQRYHRTENLVSIINAKISRIRLPIENVARGWDL